MKRVKAALGSFSLRTNNLRYSVIKGQEKLVYCITPILWDEICSFIVTLNYCNKIVIDTANIQNNCWLSACV